MSDLADLCAMADGEQGAFRALFERHFGFVYNFVFRRSADWSWAEDIAEIVFLELWRQRQQVTPTGGSIRPWLVGVASNQLKKRWRSASRRTAAYARAAAGPGTGSSGDDPADEVVARIDDEHRMRAILRVLGDLPRSQREVLQLSAWEGLDQAEIAAALGIAEGTVRSRLHRARVRLQPAIGTLPSPRESGPEALIPSAGEPAPVTETEGGR